MAIRGTETGTLKGIAAILTEIPKAYDADYSHLKKSYKRHGTTPEKISNESEIIDHDLFSDADWIDDYRECCI